MTTKFILHSTIPSTFSVVALFFVRRGTIMSIHQQNTCSSPPLFQNNIIFNYEASLYLTGHYAHNNQSTDASRLQLTNNATIIIHPWHPSSILEVSPLRFSLVYALQVLLTPPMKSHQPCTTDPGRSSHAGKVFNNLRRTFDSCRCSCGNDESKGVTKEGRGRTRRNRIGVGIELWRLTAMDIN